MGVGGRFSAAPGSEEVMRAGWMPYKLFPYERRLGLRELERLGLAELREEPGFVAGVGDPTRTIQRATYFASVADDHWNESLTAQATVEQAHLDLREGPPRQATRYGLHGIHEYKGKFNPQIVRALCNIVDSEADLLVDPFCGSGTALIEGLRLGMDVIGIDHSPIASFLARVKLSATTAESPAGLAEDLLQLANRIADALTSGQKTGIAPDGLPGSTRSYLERWFTSPALAGLTCALSLLQHESLGVAGDLVRVALSSILREVSLQLPEDLRVRRRAEPFTAPPMAPLFMEAVHGIRRGLMEIDDWPALEGTWSVMRGSAEDRSAYRDARRSSRRLILTSPPYATALPYIDTDRLSLVALGLSDAKELGALERSLIGSREWSRAEQLKWDARRLANADRMPDTVTALAELIARRNKNGDAGFRRQAVASLLYRYFARMASAIEAWYDTMQDGENAVLIVGHNHTTAGGERIDVPTPGLLGHIAESRGFEVSEIIKLETWPRYGLHAANGVAGEDALVLRRPGF